jgi:hypothetical protein
VRQQTESPRLPTGGENNTNTNDKNHHIPCGGQNPGSEPWVIEEAQAIASAYASRSACLEALGLRRRARMTFDEARRVILFDRMTTKHYRDLHEARPVSKEQVRPGIQMKQPGPTSETATRSLRKSAA